MEEKPIEQAFDELLDSYFHAQMWVIGESSYSRREQAEEVAELRTECEKLSETYLGKPFKESHG